MAPMYHVDELITDRTSFSRWLEYQKMNSSRLQRRVKGSPRFVRTLNLYILGLVGTGDLSGLDLLRDESPNARHAGSLTEWFH